MSISDNKLEANRRNAQKSTGPRTPEGKAKVAQNNWKHGLSGTFRVLPGENQQTYDDLLDEFVRVQKPADGLELQLVRKMAESNWISARAVRLQEGCIVNTSTPELAAQKLASAAVTDQLERFLRYQTAADRAYARAAAELAKCRKERLAAERGFESQKRAEAEEQRREKRQNQRDESHFLTIAIAQLRKTRLEQQLDLFPHGPKTSRKLKMNEAAPQMLEIASA